jgi:hypothetical protein
MISVRGRDALVSFAIVLVFVGIAEWKARDPTALPWLKHDFRSHHGAEYYCISDAILNGRGFSDPFRQQTGPTAWMPPVMPYAMAAFRYVIPSSSYLTYAMVFLQAIGVWLAVWIAISEGTRLRVPLWFSIPCTFIFLSTNFYQLFQMTHDTGLLLVVVGLMWISLGRWHASVSQWSAVRWGLWGGLITLCSPILGGAWVVATTTLPFGIRFLEAMRSKPLWIAFAVWGLTISPWMIRNRLVLGDWFFIKPNGMYEVWQSQCNDDDGVLDSKSTSGHPYASPSGEQMARYVKIGEMPFIREKGELAKSSIRENPLGFLERILHRAEAALIYYRSFSVMDEYFGGGWPVFFTRLVHPTPVLALMIVLAMTHPPIDRSVQKTALLFGLLLAPYILISYYDRYGAITIGLKILSVIYAVAAIKTMAFAKQKPTNHH